MTLIESAPNPSPDDVPAVDRQRVSGLLTGRHRIVHVAPVPVELGFECRRGDLHVELAGELCTSTVGLIQRPLLDLVELSQARHLAVDLSAVSFIDARGISMLLSLRIWSHARGAQMCVTAISPPVARIVALCGLSAVLVRGGRPSS